ncbi:7_t:CDS:2 [Cetraspora pellucida]|uniref:7_t:CDS:1 n=1 Tax=Cetraspora pellucida TaxID=1433469 RepID=A0ACA9M804_9GLOM|nr:7_t:CDS:2 [Cetraspora pellucida]
MEDNLKSSYLIPKFKLLSDPLAAMYSSNLDLTTNTQDENNDGFTLVSSKRKLKNQPKATKSQENGNRLKNSYETRRNPY